MCLPFDCSTAASVLSKMEMAFCCRFSFSLAQLSLFSICPLDTLIALVLTREAYGFQGSVICYNLLPLASILPGLQMPGIRTSGLTGSNSQCWCLTAVSPKDPWNTIWDIFRGETVIYLYMPVYWASHVLPHMIRTIQIYPWVGYTVGDQSCRSWWNLGRAC